VEKKRYDVVTEVEQNERTAVVEKNIPAPEAIVADMACSKGSISA
jgi:hypothetical protein